MSKVVKSIGRAIGGAVKAVVKPIAKIVNSAIKFITQPFMGMFGNIGGVPEVGNEANRQQGVLVTVQGGGDVPVPVIYGLRQVGGIVFWAETGSDTNKYLWVGYALSEGEIEGVYQVIIEDEDIGTTEFIQQLNTGAQVTLNKPGSRYSGRCVFQLWKGIWLDNPYDSNNLTGYPGRASHLLTNSPTWKPQTNIMNGVAVLMARYEWKSQVNEQGVDNNPFSGGIPSVKVTVLGKKVASLLSTGNQKDIEYEASGYEERYSTNPAEILFDYLRNPRYGKGLKNSEIDWLSFSRAAEKFNQGVQYAPGTAGPIITTNYVLDTGNSIMSNVKILLQGMRSYMPYIQGRYKLRVEDAGNETSITSGVATVVATFTKDDIVGDIVYSGVERSAQYTEVEITYVSPADKFANQTAYWPETEAERQAFRTLDGGRPNRGQFTFPTITNPYMARDMAKLLFNKSRYQQSISLTVSARGMEIEPGDNIYVRGIILDFFDSSLAPGDNVPWRVIATRLNDDYTIELECVRNPDFIYPHTQGGARDLIATPYLPGPGAPIAPFIPPEDIGVNPPGTNPGAGNPTPPPGQVITPPPTNPQDPGNGGGVGDPTNPGANPNPPTVPPPPPFTDYVEITKADYTANGNIVSAQVSFLQPAHPQYAGVVFWYKRNISTETVYTQVENTNKPGAGLNTTHIFNGLIKGSTPYIVISRVKYVDSTGAVSYSSFANKFGLNVTGAVSTENPQDNPEVVQSGWQPPNTTPDPTQKNTLFDFIQAQPTYASAGVPTTERGLNITVRQDINNSAFTNEVKGVKIYYKLASATFWKNYTHNFDGSYFPGQNYTFDSTGMDLGLSTYPNPDDTTDNYSFIFRFFYSDGSEGTQQIRFANADIENTTNAVVFGFGVGSGSPVTAINEPSTAFTPEPEPPGSVIDTREIEISVKTTGNALQGNFIVWEINPPDASNRSNWYGVRVRSRQVPLGGGDAAAFDVTDYFPVNQPTAGIWQIRHPIQYDVEYQYVLTPVVRYSGAKTEAFRSVLARGSIHNRSSALNYPSNGDWTTILKTQTINTSDVSTIQTTPFPALDPVVSVKLWRKVFKVGTTNSSANNAYFELEYNASHITGLTGVRVYRRANLGSGYGTITNGTAKYYGYGRWEYVDVVPGTNATTLANGNVLVNLRAPVSHEEFNPSYQVPTAAPSSQVGLLWTLGQWAASTGKKILRPLNGSLGNTTTPSRGWDYVIVVSTSSGTSIKCLRLPVITGTLLTVPDLPQELDFGTFDGFDAGYQRNITPNANNGSRVSIANANLLINNSATATYIPPTANRGSAIV